MVTTVSRKLRRSASKEVTETIALILFDYETSPLHALRDCHETYGRAKFEVTLSHYLSHKTIRDALRSTILFLSQETTNGKTN
jgi:hypothetical protein